MTSRVGPTPRAGTRRRVLWLTKGLGPGGAERLLVEQARAGNRDRFDYEAAFLLDQKRHLVPELEALDVPTHCFGVRRELDPRWVPRLRRVVIDGGFDVVHAHSPVPAIALRVVRRTLPAGRRPALVYTEHNRWSSHHRLTRAANRSTITFDDHVFAVSSDVRDSMTPHRRPVEVLVHGIDTERVRAYAGGREATRSALGVPPGQVLSVTVANLRATKNYPGLLATARTVIDRGVPMRFVAAGQGPLVDEVGAEHARLGLGEHFSLLGYRDDATALVAAADLFVLASHHEGLPVTVMEAMVLGVPVVAPAVGGIAEVVTDGTSGLLVAPGDVEALADAITRVACDPELRAHLSDGARATGDRFSSAAAVARIEAVYDQLTGGSELGR